MDSLQTLTSELKNSIGNRDNWTPDSGEVARVIDYFITQVEPEWIESVTRRDPALNRHLGLAEEDLKAFREGHISLNELRAQQKVARETIDEITKEVRSYQGLHAVAFHHIAHTLYESYLTKKASGERSAAAADLLLARQISQGVRRLTAGIEIHPGAKIGKHFFIDHGAAAVIGETAEIGENVHFYHNITLGASSGKEAEEGGPIPRRHPKIGNKVTISNNVNILGPVIVGDGVDIGTSVVIKQIKNEPLTVGENSTIQDGVMVTRAVPANVRVVGQISALPGMDPKLQGELIIRPKGSKNQDKPLTTIIAGAFATLEKWVAQTFAPAPTATR